MDIYKILLYKFDLKYFFCYNSEKGVGICIILSF